MDENTVEKNSKRRKRGEGSVSAFNKKLKSEGKAYVNSKNQQVEAKKPPPDKVACKCYYQCKAIPYEQKLKLFTAYHDLGDHVKQNSFLMGLLNVTTVNRRRHGKYENSDASRRQTTVYFTLPNGNGKIEVVCKSTFMETFGITRRLVETLVKARKSGDIVYTEKRGNKKTNRKYTAEDEKNVIDHINSFPKDKSHYTRAKNDNDYLSEDLNVHRMYLAFKDLHLNTTLQYRYYIDTLKKHFPKLRFKKPRKDTCGTCDLLKTKMLNESVDREGNKNTLEIHHRKAEAARNAMQLDHEECQKVNSDMSTISIDLQQVFSLPTLTHSQMYYLRQLSCFNLGVHVGDTNTGYMFVWHEGLSGRGGNEIASCLLKGLTSRITQRKKLSVWSDNCIGQNKNQMMIFLWVYLVSTNVFDEIEHKFLVSGHSYLSCDRDFAQIEKRKRVEKCEVPLDIVRLLCHACHKNPFMATLMQKEDFLDFKNAASLCLNTKNLEISKAQWIKISKDNPGVVCTKKTFSEIETWSKTKVLKKGVTLEQLKENLKPLETMNCLKPEKKEDLKKIIPFLKEENKDFFKEVVGCE